MLCHQSRFKKSHTYVPNSCALQKMLNLYLLVMWRKHLLLSQFRIKSWSPKSAGPLRRKNCQPCFPFLSFFGNYPRGFEVLIRQCWLIPAVHNLCYYWMITWDHGREERRERARGWVKSEKKTCSSRRFQTDSPLHQCDGRISVTWVRVITDDHLDLRWLMPHLHHVFISFYCPLGAAEGDVNAAQMFVWHKAVALHELLTI